VSADIKSLAFAPGYQYDIIRRNTISLSIAVQVYLLNTSADLKGVATVNGQTETRTASGSLFAPLPMLGPRVQLALVSIELEQVQRKLPDSVSEHRSKVGELRKRIIDISTDVQMMSHELHSAKLSYLGAAVAMRGFCREFGEHHKFEIEFQSRDVPRQLPPDVSLCLFRVLQEALHNAAKHSGVKRFDVQLWGTSGDVHLTISDLGSGFDTEAAMKGRGLGITSMQERLKLVKGELTITSHPKSGTSIHARVPLESEDQSAWAAG